MTIKVGTYVLYQFGDGLQSVGVVIMPPMSDIYRVLNTSINVEESITKDQIISIFPTAIEIPRIPCNAEKFILGI